MSNQLGRGQRALLPLCGLELRRLGHTHSLPVDLGQDALPTG
jgi:hypothetical protein